ncbi:hypothetical protein WA026_000954 [Henosepilachna vigintioctopunctata]|uniref:Protein FAM92A n=1 Tax=Henosepilachna vigintioctopunctata TaxID=420089 RepID=A0AAW1V0Y6_9CUCU
MLNFRTRNNCEQEARFIQERLISVEHNVAELCSSFAHYSKKLAKLRDEGDELAKITLKYAENEEINKTLSLGLENFSAALQILGDYGDNRVRSIDQKVVAEFSKYDNICKQVKEEIKQIFNAKDKEISRKRQLDRIRERTPKNRQQIVQAEAELIRASAEVSKTIQNIEDKTTNFEKQKLHDMKEIFLDFIAIEMGYHSKALQVLTKIFELMYNIDEKSDLQDFKKALHLSAPSSVASGDYNNRNSLFKAPSLGSLGAIFSTNHRKKSPGIPGARKRSQSEENLDSLKTPLSDTEETRSDVDLSESPSESNTESVVTRKRMN